VDSIFQVERNNDYSDIDFASRLCTSVPAHTERDNHGCFLTAGGAAAARDRAPPGSLDAHPAGAGRQAALHIALAGVACHAKSTRILDGIQVGNRRGLPGLFILTRRSRGQGLCVALRSVLARAFGGPDRLRCGV
jgi:hypothetical protein